MITSTSIHNTDIQKMETNEVVRQGKKAPIFDRMLELQKALDIVNQKSFEKDRLIESMGSQLDEKEATITVLAQDNEGLAAVARRNYTLSGCEKIRLFFLHIFKPSVVREQVRIEASEVVGAIKRATNITGNEGVLKELTLSDEDFESYTDREADEIVKNHKDISTDSDSEVRINFSGLDCPTMAQDISKFVEGK